MLNSHDIDVADLIVLPARHTAPTTTTVIAVIAAATYDADLAAWLIELLDGTDTPVIAADLDGAAIAAAGAAAWRPGQVAAVELGDWAGRSWDVAVHGGGIEDVLALPAAPDPSWTRLITHAALLTTS